MSVKRISELDKVTKTVQELSANLDDYLIEVSEWVGERNEANSYYVSKQITGDLLKDAFTSEISSKIDNLCAYTHNEFNKVWSEINNIHNEIENISVIINKWITEGMNLENISCTNLTVQNDISGCCLSAKWL